MGKLLWLFLIVLAVGCRERPQPLPSVAHALNITDTLLAKKEGLADTTHASGLIRDRAVVDSPLVDTVRLQPSREVAVKNVQPGEVVKFAQTLKGIPYVYASSDPKIGFDCSGFITHVFNKFGISVPRSSIDFTQVGKEVPADQAKPGDLILFTGTNPAERVVGHMGIVLTNTDTLRFIHSTSGKAMSVTVTPLNGYYLGRYIKTIRVFPQNDR